MQILGPQHPRTQCVDQWITGVGGVEHRLTAHVGQTQGVAVTTHAAHHTVDDAPGVGGIGGTEAQLIHHRDRPSAHRHDVADDATHTGGRTLVGLDVARVIVRLDLEGDSPAVTDIDDAGVLADSGEHRRPHLVGGGLPEVAQVHLRRFVAAMFGPHHRVHREFGVGGAATEDLFDPVVLVVLESELAERLRMIGGLGSG